jgi:hypothetical protein
MQKEDDVTKAREDSGNRLWKRRRKREKGYGRGKSERKGWDAKREWHEKKKRRRKREKGYGRV